MESTCKTWLTVLQHKAQRGWYRRTERCHPLWKGGKSVVRPHPTGGRFQMWWAQIFFFCINKEYFILLCLKSCFAAITYQMKHYFDFSNCKFTCRFLIFAIRQGSPCRRSSDNANTDWVHCLRPRCRVKCDLEPTSAGRWVCDRDHGNWCQRSDDVTQCRIASRVVNGVTMLKTRKYLI